MAGGVSYHVGQVAVGASTGTRIYDIISFGAMLDGERLHNRADGRLWPQSACTVNHTGRIEYTGLDLSQGAQASSSSPLIGSQVNTAKLTILNTSSGSMVYTMSPAEVAAFRVSGRHGDLAQIEGAYESVGNSGNEPTLSWAYAA